MGARPGRIVGRLGEPVLGRINPERRIDGHVPFTKLPRALFDGAIEWHVAEAGRWKWDDHITLGEARAVVRLTARLATFAGAHRSRIISLQDNLPTTCSMTKGRSPKHQLNYLIRRRAASSLGASLQVLLPWVQSKLQVADEASRAQSGAAKA